MKEITSFEQIGRNKNGEYRIKHKILENGNEYIIKAEMKVSKESEYIDKCKEKNTSPITQILKKIEREHNQLIKEGKTERKLYIE